MLDKAERTAIAFCQRFPADISPVRKYNHIGCFSVSLMKKIAFNISRALRGFVPSGLFRMFLLFLKKIFPCLAGKFEILFDPENISRVVGFDSDMRIVDISGAGWKLKVNWNDHIGYRSYLDREPFEMAVYAVAEILHNDKRDTILDIGANIGSASIPICAVHNLKLIAVEASKNNASLLIENAMANGVLSQIHLFALSDKRDQGYLKFYTQKGNTGANSLLNQWVRSDPAGDTEIEHVPSTTLDDLMSFSGAAYDEICVVKIDVEGAEQMVLQGGSAFLEENSAPIIFEYRIDATKKYLNDDMSGLIGLLEDAGYEFFAIRSIPLQLEAFDAACAYENVVALKSDSFALDKLNAYILGG